MNRRRRKFRTKYGPIFRPFRGLVKLFKKSPVIVDLNDEPVEKNAIFLSNHSGASGPMTLSLYMPTFIVPWGTYEMVGNYPTRWKYLYYVFYQQKIGYKKFKSFILATLLAVISKMLYRGMQLIPTYQDLRLSYTIKNSMDALDAGIGILIFPEDSSTGYFDELTSYNGGFALLHERYYKQKNIDIPIYPLYYSKKHNALYIGKKEYVKPLYDRNLTRDEIAEHFKNVTNEYGAMLFEKYGE